jgi:hypothetical protein
MKTSREPKLRGHCCVALVISLLKGKGERKEEGTYTSVVDSYVVADWFEGDTPVAFDLGAVAAPAAFAFLVVGGVGGEPAVVGALFEGGGVVEDGLVCGVGCGRFCSVGGWEGESGGAGAEEGCEEGCELHDGCCRRV